MKLLLTSSGIRNTSIQDALVELLGKPVAESSALCIPTGVQPFPDGPSQSTDSSADRAAAPCVAWVGNRWECWN